MKHRLSFPLATVLLALSGWFSEVTAQTPTVETAEISGIVTTQTPTGPQQTEFQGILHKATDGSGVQGEMLLAQLPQAMPETADALNVSDVAEAVPPTPVATAQPTVQFISPGSGTILEKNASAVVIEVPTGSTTTLSVNGVAIDPNQIGQLETNGSTGLVRQTWYGGDF